MKPEIVDLGTSFVSRQLDAPFASIFVGIVLPSGNYTLLLRMLDSGDIIQIEKHTRKR